MSAATERTAAKRIEGLVDGYAEIAEKAAALLKDTADRLEAAERQRQSAMNKLAVAESLMMSAGWWRNEDGYLTDAALWIDQAQKALAP